MVGLYFYDKSSKWNDFSRLLSLSYWQKPSETKILVYRHICATSIHFRFENNLSSSYLVLTIVCRTVSSWSRYCTADTDNNDQKCKWIPTRHNEMFWRDWPGGRPGRSSSRKPSALERQPLYSFWQRYKNIQNMSKLQQIETLLAFQLPNCFSFKTFDILLSRRLALLTHLESEFAISVQRLSAPNITVTSASVRWTLLMSGCVSVTSDPMLAKEAAAVQVSPSLSLSLHGSNLTKLSSTRRSKCQSMQITVARSAPIFFSVCRAKHFSRLQTAFMLFSNVW